MEETGKTFARIANAATDSNYGCPPEKREMQSYLRSGIIIVDKPCGPSSHEVGAWVKRLVGAEKSGHSGTLDPLVSGVLPVALDDATKALTFMLKSNKEYVGIMRFHKDISEKAVKRLFVEYTGTITQLPPVRSAVKRQERQRSIYALKLIEFNGRDALFSVACEAGTYVRKLCHDIGRKAGTGANMVELRRTRAAGFDESTCHTLHELTDAMWLWKEKGEEKELRRVVMPVEAALHMRRLHIADGAVEAVCAGAQLALPGIVKFDEGIKEADTVAIMTQKGELVAVAKALMGAEAMKSGTKGLAASTVRVVMRAGTYPRGWKKHENAPQNTPETGS